MKNRKLTINTFATLCFTLLLPFLSRAQEEDRKLMREANKLYKDSKFDKSELNLRKALQKAPASYTGNFNLGDALYKQGKFGEATDQFKKIAGQDKDKASQAKVFHNLGNSLLQDKKYEESIDAYKRALKALPEDKDTKYNLAYAKMMLQQQQKQQQNKDKNKDKKDQDKKDQNKQDSKDKKDQEKKDQDKQDQKDKKDQDKKDEKQKQQQKPQQKISKEDAERMLEAMKNQEKNLQKKLGKKEAVRVQVEKDW